MPVTLRWYEPDAILNMEVQGHVTSEDLDAWIETLSGYLEAATRPIHLISDWQAASNYPIQPSLIPRAAPVFRHDNMGWVAMVGVNPSLAFWAEVLTKLAGLRYRIFETVDAAAEHLQDIDKARRQASS
jgi:hypothetical protein